MPVNVDTPTPMAFMSSKPLAGFNHKHYGVTSEGVVVNLEVALKNCLGIDPRKDKFTIKITEDLMATLVATC